MNPTAAPRETWLKVFSAAQDGQRCLLLGPRCPLCPWDEAPRQQWETSRGEMSGRRRLEEGLLYNELF